MTAIDFSAFVDELASVSGETILPFFRTALSIEDKGRAGGFDQDLPAPEAVQLFARAGARAQEFEGCYGVLFAQSDHFFLQ